jgi:hypothetical protein
MANYVGGDIIEITYNHPVIGSGTLFCKSNEDGTLDLGGFRSNDDANSITGDGKLIDQLNRVRASFETPPIAWDMTEQDELKKLSEMTESPILADWTIESISGSIWGGRGKPVGDIQGNTNTDLITLKLAFEGKLEQIAT